MILGFVVFFILITRVKHVPGVRIRCYPWQTRSGLLALNVQFISFNAIFLQTIKKKMGVRFGGVITRREVLHLHHLDINSLNIFIHKVNVLNFKCVCRFLVILIFGECNFLIFSGNKC